MGYFKSVLANNLSEELGLCGADQARGLFGRLSVGPRRWSNGGWWNCGSGGPRVSAGMVAQAASQPEGRRGDAGAGQENRDER